MVIFGLAEQIARAAIVAIQIMTPIIAVVLVRVHWRESNRPIVVAYLNVEGSGEADIVYSLNISNIGNRPAYAVALIPDRNALQAATKTNRSPEQMELFTCCFEKESEIPLLLPGGSTKSAFGTTGRDGDWVPGSKIPLTVTYNDINGRSHKERGLIRIADPLFFAGPHWTKDSQDSRKSHDHAATK